jgi:F-type H+-transporting ATPase subunit epsilon
MDNIKLQLNMISPERKIFSGEISSATFPGIAGFFGIQPGHAPLISSLKKGKIVYTIGGEPRELDVERGIVEMYNGVITACVEQSVKK